ncbi:hypothetical protein BIW11_05655 [Tropilaelaps mercedesae]|uniref:Uncharacterized protein n=1 Tax=Tropilaelaps mercedesae TaxID=418985 RepID=A0A1V9Y1E7_9ACAR|nr:hypothetical protein BIW11_05655 [Tropilaelaps mercedesae]
MRLLLFAFLTTSVLHLSVGMKKFEKGALAYLLFKGLQPKPQASEMMVMLPGGMDLSEMKVPMMMMVMPVSTSTTHVTPAMMAANMMGMTPMTVGNGPADMSPMTMAQMMHHMMLTQSSAASKDNNKKDTSAVAAMGPNANMMNMMIEANGNGAMMPGVNGGGSMVNPESVDIPTDDSSKNMVEALMRYEALHHKREHTHRPVPVRPVHAPRVHVDQQ